MPGVLDGIRVLDLSEGIAGPLATMLLADHGAAVTKIERPGGAPFRQQGGRRGGLRGRRSAVLDLKEEADREVLRWLVRAADILVESFRPGKALELGLDFETLQVLNPKLIHCSITGYDASGPHAARPGFDALVAARSGLQWEQRGREGGPAVHHAGDTPFAPDFKAPAEALQGPDREGPLFPASRFPSLGAAYAATTAISAALRAREVTGRGQHVATSLWRGALSAGVLVYGQGQKLDAFGFASWIGDQRAPMGLIEWTRQYSETGVMGEAEKATAEKGRLCFEEASKNLAAWIGEYYHMEIMPRTRHQDREPTIPLNFPTG